MKEYIERTAVEKFIEDGLNNPDKNKAYGHDAIEIMAEVHYMPAADVAEVKHGRWILEREPDGTPYCLHCSVCDNDFHHVGIMTAIDYCPNCGARMDKEDEHEVS